MADVGKLISLGNLLVRKVRWLVLTTTSATLVLSRAFGADCMTRIAYIYSRLPSTHSLTFFTHRDSTRSLSLTHTHTHAHSEEYSTDYIRIFIMFLFSCISWYINLILFVLLVLNVLFSALFHIVYFICFVIMNQHNHQNQATVPPQQ